MKKLFVLVAAIAMVAQAQAGFFGKKTKVSSSTSWSTLKKLKNSVVEFDVPSLKLANAGNTSVMFVCVDGDEFRTIKKIKKCVSRDRLPGDRRGEYRCTEYKEFYGVQAMTYDAKVCAKYARTRGGEGNCIKYRTVTIDVPLSYEIPVYKARRTNRRDGNYNSQRGRKLFTKNYTIPSCH